MILNKKEWATVNEIMAVLIKYAPVMRDKDRQKIDDFIYLTAEATKKQKEARTKTAQNDISTTYKKFFDDNQYKTNTQLFCTLNDIKNKIGDALFLKIGTSYYSVKPLKKMLRTFDKNLVFYFQNNSNQSILYIIDINYNDGILLPVRENFINKEKAVIL